MWQYISIIINFILMSIYFYFQLSPTIDFFLFIFYIGVDKENKY